MSQNIFRNTYVFESSRHSKLLNPSNKITSGPQSGKCEGRINKQSHKTCIKAFCITEYAWLHNSVVGFKSTLKTIFNGVKSHISSKGVKESNISYFVSQFKKGRSVLHNVGHIAASLYCLHSKWVWWWVQSGRVELI